MGRDQTPTEWRILRVLDHIHDHPAGDLSLDLPADVAALGRFHWHRQFRAVTGKTVAQAVRRIRLHRASAAPVQPDQPVPAIARAVGHDSLDSFARAFRDAYGMTAAAFRRWGELRPFNPHQPAEGPLMHPVTIRTDPARRLAAVPHRGPYPEIGRAFEELSASMATRGLFAHAGAMAAVFYDDPSVVAAADLRCHAGFVIIGDAPLAPPLEELTLSAGRVAVPAHTGPYAGLPAAYDQLFAAWLPGSRETAADRPMFEVYLSSPMDTAPADLVTEVCLPLQG
jgi:AraC family transcriptional regulator